MLRKYSFLLPGIIIMISANLIAQKKKQDQPVQAQSSVDAKIKGLKKYPGFLEYYYDEKADKVWLLISKWNIEFLYIESLTAAIGSNDIGLDRNQLGSQRILKLERRGPKVLLIEPNNFYRATSDNEAERKAVEESFAQSVLWGFKVEEEDQDASGSTRVLVDATDFLLQDVHNVAGTLRNAHEGNFSLDRSRSAFYPERMRNFPQNTEIEVILTLTGEATGDYLPTVTPNSASFTVREHHSFVQLPDGNFKPRAFDPRAGYFNTSFYDYGRPFTEPLEQRLITRHRLSKKDPAAAVSEPVKPIIYYVDPGAPAPVREALIAGASWWNQAFEAAGYKNAFRVEVLPADADPMDVRYNVISWVHRSTRGWSYGASVTDPRTGEIIKGHVSLGSLRDRQDFLLAEGLLAPYEDGKPLSKALEEMTLNRLRQLAAHEVGHTLGLAHSYTSSSENRASVMDYPQPYVSIIDGKIDLSKAYDNGIGAWDKVAIAYGYQDYPAGTDEAKASNLIIQNSLKAGLTFLSDQDARPAGGAHPFAHLWDNGKDVADELNRMMEIRTVALRNFGEKNIRPGAPLATIEEALVPIYFYHRYQAEAAAKLIGGLNYRYAIKGDGQLVTAFVSPAQQTKAVDALLKTVSPEALMLSENLLQIIPPRPLGYDRHRELIQIRTSLTFDAVALAESAAGMVFEFILHPARANRLLEYHARDAQQPGLDKIIDQLVTGTIKATPKAGYAGVVQQAVDYMLLTKLAALSQNAGASLQVKAVALAKINQLRNYLTSQNKLILPDGWKEQTDYMIALIDLLKAQPDKFKIEHLNQPPGSPIGIDVEFCGR